MWRNGLMSLASRGLRCSPLGAPCGIKDTQLSPTRLISVTAGLGDQTMLSPGSRSVPGSGDEVAIMRLEQRQPHGPGRLGPEQPGTEAGHHRARLCEALDLVG